MRCRVNAPRPVVVHNQIVDAEDAAVCLQDAVRDHIRQFRGRLGADKQCRHLADNLNCGPGDQEADEQSGGAVDIQPPDGVRGGRREDGARRPDVGEAVLRRGKQNGRRELFAAGAVEEELEEFHADRGDQGGDRPDVGVERPRRDDAENGAVSELERDEQHTDRDDRRRDVFETGMAERVFLVGGFRRQRQGDDRHDRTERIRQVVPAVRGDRDTAGQRADDQLQRREEHIHEQAENRSPESILLPAARRGEDEITSVLFCFLLPVWLIILHSSLCSGSA